MHAAAAPADHVPIGQVVQDPKKLYVFAELVYVFAEQGIQLLELEM